MDGIFAMAAIVEIAFLSWMGLKISHRVAGPLYRLRSEMLRTARGGELTRLKFRDGDYFEELADAYNEQMAEIRKRDNAAWSTPKFGDPTYPPTPECCKIKPSTLWNPSSESQPSGFSPFFIGRPIIAIQAVTFARLPYAWTAAVIRCWGRHSACDRGREA